MDLYTVLPTEQLISKISDVHDQGGFFASKILFVPSWAHTSSVRVMWLSNHRID